MLINLQQIVDEINGRRNRIKYQFQELAMMLSEKLGDPAHKSLYMKIAKYEEQELIMDAMHYVLASPNASGNLGPLFMWKMKELKARPLHPLTLRLDVVDGYFKVGVISNVTRGDMPLLVAGLTDFSENNKEKSVTIKSIVGKQVELEQNIYVGIPQKLTELLKEFKRKCTVSIFQQLQWNGSRELKIGENIVGVLKLGTPVLTKRFPAGRMPTV